MINFDHSTLDDVTIVEVLDGGVDGSEEVLSGANVIDGYLRGCRSGHMLSAPKRIVIEKRTGTSESRM